LRHQTKQTAMNNFTITRNNIGIYTITLVDYDLEFTVENLTPYKIEGLKGWEVGCRSERGEDITNMYTDTLRSAKCALKYFTPEDYGIEKKVD